MIHKKTKTKKTCSQYIQWIEHSYTNLKNKNKYRSSDPLLQMHTDTNSHRRAVFFCFFVGGNSVNIFSPFSRRLLGWNISERRINPKHDGGPAASPTETRDFCLFCCQYFVAEFFFLRFFCFFFSWATWHSVSQCFLLGILQQDKKHTCIIFQVLQGKTNVHLKIAFTNFWFRVYSPLDCQPSCLHFYRTSIESVTAKKNQKTNKCVIYSFLLSL